MTKKGGIFSFELFFLIKFKLWVIHFIYSACVSALGKGTRLFRRWILSKVHFYFSILGRSLTGRNMGKLAQVNLRNLIPIQDKKISFIMMAKKRFKDEKNCINFQKILSRLQILILWIFFHNILMPRIFLRMLFFPMVGYLIV